MSEKEEQVRQRAYELWQQEGEPQGRDEEFWQRALTDVTQQSAQDAIALGDTSDQNEPSSPAQVTRKKGLK